MKNRSIFNRCCSLTWSICLVALASSVSAQALTHPNPKLDWIYPSGAQLGQTLEVEFGGAGGLTDAMSIHIEGPPGLMFTEVKAHDGNRVTAKLTVAADAPPGRRNLRVVGGTNGLTNPRSFLVGRLPELLEPVGADEFAVQDVPTPVIINGQLNPKPDVDRFRFVGRAGQSIVVSVTAHRIDSLRPGPNKDFGFLDTSLELLNEHGVIVAADDDTLGLDPLVHCTLPADGAYTVVLKALSYQGFPGAVYRLLIGDVPYPTAIYPAGGRRGETIEVEVSGINIEPGTKVKVQVPNNDEFLLTDVLVPGPTEGNVFFPFHCSTDPELLETSEPHLRDHAQPLPHPCVVNGRFLAAGEEDWYSIELKAKENVTIEVVADRYLRSPVDSFIEIYDASGQKVRECDDGGPATSQYDHEYESLDSWLSLGSSTDATYYLRVVNQTTTFGNRAVYRLLIRPYDVDFSLFQWPDAVPIWGPGGTSTFVVSELHVCNFEGEIELRVEGLPPGWSASTSRLDCGPFKGHTDSPGELDALMTITAPVDAVRGTMVPFRVVGKAVVNGRTIEHAAQPCSLLGIADRFHFARSRQSWAAVGAELDCRLETAVTEISGHPGETIQVPVKIHRAANALPDTGLAVDSNTTYAFTAMQPPTPVPAGQAEMLLPVRIAADRKPGNYGMIISRSWAGDLRHSRPGPSAPLVLLHVLPPEATGAK